MGSRLRSFGNRHGSSVFVTLFHRILLQRHGPDWLIRMALGEQTFLVCAGIEPFNILLDTRAAFMRFDGPLAHLRDDSNLLQHTQRVKFAPAFDALTV